MPEYPRDEFDELAAAGGPVGVHRGQARRVWPWIAPLVMFAVGGAIAYLYVIFLWHQGGGQGLPPIGVITEPAVTETRIVGPTESAVTTSPTTSASPEATASPTPTEVPVNFAASVSVLNGAKVSGLAGTNADKLKAAGFTAVTADNISDGLPAVNTVRYADAAYASTAAKVAEVLGITTVEMGATPQGSVSVILVTKN